MNPPAGRIKLGERVTIAGGRQGRVSTERLIATNGAWKYDVILDDGAVVECLDYELRRAPQG